MRSGKSGFTLVELIVVIVIVGIVALIAAPRFFAQAGFDAARFHDAAISAIRYGQKVAQAQHTNVYVVTSANAVAVCYDAACATAVKSPADNNAAFVVNAPSGIGLIGSGFNFTSLGQPNPNAKQTLTVTGDTVVRQIVVEQETGYAHK
jgi:MSHA pilin protein MshC